MPPSPSSGNSAKPPALINFLPSFSKVGKSLSRLPAASLPSEMLPRCPANLCDQPARLSTAFMSKFLHSSTYTTAPLGCHQASSLPSPQSPASAAHPPPPIHQPSAPGGWRDPPALCPYAQVGHKSTLTAASEATGAQPRVPGEGTKQTARCSRNSSFSHKRQQLFNEAPALPRDNSQFPGAGRICSSATDY